MSTYTYELASKLQKVANFYDEFGLSPKIATLLHDASTIVISLNVIIDKNNELKSENAKLREENERIIKIHVPRTINTDVLEQYSRERIVELAMYWYEEAVYWQNEYEDLQSKFKAMEGVSE